MLAPTVTLQGFQPIAGRDTQVVKTLSVVEETQFSQCPSLYIGRKPSTASARPNRRCLGVAIADDHEEIL